MNVMLAKICDADLINETARRLLNRFKMRHGIEMKYGGFNFIVHEGKFDHVEDRLKDKSYFSNTYKSLRGGKK